jgi:hypothetical protein
VTDNIMREMHPSNDESRRDVTGVENATVHDERRKTSDAEWRYEKNESRICKTSQYKF